MSTPPSTPERRPRRVRRVAIRATVLVAVIGGSFAAIQYANADAAGHGYGYVWASSPGATIGAPYTPDLSYQGNSSGAQNTITHTDTGRYTVRFPHLGALGTATVSAYGNFSGNSDDRCKLVNWGGDGAGGTLLNVACYNRLGSVVDSYFTASYTYVSRFTASGRGAYVWNDRATSTGGSFVPNRSYQFNSLGRTNTIFQESTGVYDVTLGGFGHSKGANWNVAVTAYGLWGADPSAFCSGSGDLSTTTDAIILVQCYDASGALTDSNFALTYVEKNNLLFAPQSSHPTSMASVGCDAEELDCGISPTQTNSAGGTSTLDILGGGQFAVHIPESLNTGDVQLTQWFTQTTSNGRCKIMFWNPTDGIRVNCYDNSGNPTSAGTFILNFVSFG